MLIPVLYFSQNSCNCPLADAWYWVGWSCGLTWSGQSVFLCEPTSLPPPRGLYKSRIRTALLVHKCIKITAPVVCGWSLWNSQYFPGHNLSVPSWHICWWSVSRWPVGHNDRLRGCDLPVPSALPGGYKGPGAPGQWVKSLQGVGCFIQCLAANLGIMVSLLFSFKHHIFSQSNHTTRLRWP